MSRAMPCEKQEDTLVFLHLNIDHYATILLLYEKPLTYYSVSGPVIASRKFLLLAKQHIREPMEQAGEQNEEQQQARHDQETRQRILKAAERLFLERGFKGVSMKDIAEEVHVTSAALYYHFPEGKQELFLDMVKMLFEEWYANTKRIIAEASTLED